MAIGVVAGYGQCEAEYVAPIFQCTDSTCSILGCSDTASSFPISVPIKTCIEGTVLSPYVRIRFGDNINFNNDSLTEITTGNLSQPCNSDSGDVCNAVIKSFQYSWSFQSGGARCKVSIVDDYGASLYNWFRRIMVNPEAGSAPRLIPGYNKMRAQWGWIVSGTDSTCPTYIPPTEQPCCLNPNCTCTTSCGGGPCTGCVTPTTSNNGMGGSNTICSPWLTFLARDMVINTQQNGRFTYEIEGVDLMSTSTDHASARVYTGMGGAGLHFVDAVNKLADESIPPFNVSFLQFNEHTGQVEPLEFYNQPDVGIANLGNVLIAENDPDVQTLGPILKWPANERDPLAIIYSWIKNVRAFHPYPNGSGLVMNYDASYENCDYADGEPGATVQYGRFIIWRDVAPNCAPLSATSLNNRLKGIYIVNGGQASPVYSFTPSIKSNFSALALRAGGNNTPTTGTQTKSSSQTPLCPGLAAGRGLRQSQVVNSSLIDSFGGRTAQVATIDNQAAHRRANILYNSIEADLKIQGDPSDYYCTPVAGPGCTLGIVYINPFYLVDTAGCPEWSQLENGSCNDFLTNRGYMLRAADHLIQAGSYTTTLKLFLPYPGLDIPDVQAMSPLSPTPLGGDSLAENICCDSAIPDDDCDVTINPGTSATVYDYPLGFTGVQSGVGQYGEAVSC